MLGDLKNRHKFRSFTERIASVSADVSQSFELSLTTPRAGDTATYFSQTLTDSLKSRLDPSYAKFSQSLLPISRTLPQMLFHKDEIFNIIFKYLDQPLDAIRGGIEDVFKLIVQLARDLRSEFYPYFNKLFGLLVNHFEASTAEYIEAFFQCVVFLFKFLSKPLVADIENVMSQFVPAFFASEKEYTRRLSAEALAFLLRQVPDRKLAHTQITNLSEQLANPETRDRVIDSLGQTLFYEIKNVGGSVRSQGFALVEQLSDTIQGLLDDAFLKANELLAESTVSPHNVEFVNHLISLEGKLPANTLVHSLSVWASKSTMLDPEVLCKGLNVQNASPESLVSLLSSLDSLDLTEETRTPVCHAITIIAESENSSSYFDSLKKKRKIASLSAETLLSLLPALPEGSLLPVLEFLRVDAKRVPQAVKDRVLDIVKRDPSAFPLAEFSPSEELYNVLKSVENDTPEFRTVLMKLARIYDPSSLIEIPLSKIKNLAFPFTDLEEASNLLLAVNLSVPLNPTWLKPDSPEFEQLIGAIDFSTDNMEFSKTAASILRAFLPPSFTPETLSLETQIVYTADVVFNIVHSLEAHRLAEGQLARMAANSSRMTDRIRHKAFNVAIGACRHNVKSIREAASRCLSSILSTDPSLGKLTTQYLIGASHLFGNSLVDALTQVKYSDANVILAAKTASPNLLVPLLKLMTIKKTDGSDELSSQLLTSQYSEVRKAALAIQLCYNNVDQSVAQTLEAFANPEKHMTLLMEFENQVNGPQRLFVVKTAVALVTGVLYETAIDNHRGKNKRTQVIRSTLQTLAFLEPSEVAPLLQAVVSWPEASKVILPVLQRLGQHAKSLGPEISEALLKGLKSRTRSLRSSAKACAAFIDVAPPGFCGRCMDVMSTIQLKVNEVISLLIKIAQFEPSAFTSPVVDALIETAKQGDPDSIRVLTSVADTKDEFRESIIEAAIEVSKGKRVASTEVFTIFLDIFSSKWEHQTGKEADLFSTVCVNRAFEDDIKSMSFLSRVSLNAVEFDRLLQLIPRHLTHEFRSALVDIVAPYLLELEGPFRAINSSSEGDRATAYAELPVKGKLIGAFVQQAISDMQSENFTLQQAAFGFIVKAATDRETIERRIEPAVRYHLGRRSTRLRITDLVRLISLVVNGTPEKHQLLLSLSSLPKLASISDEERDHALSEMTEELKQKATPVNEPELSEKASDLKESDDESDQEDDKPVEDAEQTKEYDQPTVGNEVDGLLLPLLSILPFTESLPDTLIAACHYASARARETLFHRLSYNVSQGYKPTLLYALAGSNLIRPSTVSRRLLKLITAKGTGSKAQLNLITATLKADSSYHVVNRLANHACNKIQSKRPEVRETAQQALKAISAAMKPGQYLYLFQSLRSNLIDGYKVPLFYLAMKNIVVSAQNPRSFDEFINPLTETLLEDIFGYKAEMRVSLSQRVPEARRCSTFDTFCALAANTDFVTAGSEMIRLLDERFSTLTTLEQVKGSHKLIDRVSEGFTRNESIDAEKLISLIQSLIKSNFYFAVRVFYDFLSRNLFDFDSESQVELVGKAIKELWNEMKVSKETESLTLAMKSLHLTSELPGFTEILPDFLNWLTETLSRLHSAADDFGSTVFAVLQTLLTRAGIDLPTKFCRALITFCHSQLDIAESSAAVFGVLESLIEMSNLPEMIDVIETASDLCIRAQSDTVRKLSAKLTASFIVKQNMPIVQKKLMFFLSNLQAKRTTSKIGCLRFISNFLKKGTEAQIDALAEVMFTYLGVALANETDKDVSARLKKIVGKLLIKVPPGRFMTLWGLMGRWSSQSGNQARVGLLLLSAAVASVPDAMEGLIQPLREIVDAHLPSENEKIRLSAIDLHRQMVSSYPEVDTLPMSTVIGLIKVPNTARIGCELLYSYVSNEKEFSDSELLEAANAVYEIIINWRGSIKESNESLHHILSKLSIESLENFIKSVETPPNPDLTLILMRVFAATLSGRQFDSKDATLGVLKFMAKVRNQRELKKPVSKAIDFIRNSLDPEMFSELWGEIIKEEEESKKAEQLELEAEKLLDPEEAKKRAKERRKKALAAKRAASYYDPGAFGAGTLYAFGPDGERISGVELAPEFRDAPDAPNAPE